MQAVILAAGKSSRFWPLGSAGHKSLVRLFGKAVLEHTIDEVKKSGIEDIIVVSRDGKSLEKVSPAILRGVSEAVQKEPKGMGDAILCAKDKINGPFFVLNSNHIRAKAAIAKCIEAQQGSGSGIVLTGTKTNSPELYGVFEFEGNMAKGIVEKPKKEDAPSGTRVAGIYLLSKEFLGILEKTPQEEYSFEAALSSRLRENKAPVVILDKSEQSPSLKYPWHLFSVLKALFEYRFGKTSISETAKISKSASIDDSKGPVIIGENTKVMENAVIRGPVYIGSNCLVGNNAIVREYADIEDHVKIGAGSEVARSIIQAGVHMHSGFVGDSIIDSGAKIGAGIITANKRIDRGETTAEVNGMKTGTGLTSFGCAIGTNTVLGVSVKTMPGVLIGTDVTVGSGTVVEKNIPSKTKYYTKFREIIEKKK